MWSVLTIQTLGVVSDRVNSDEAVKRLAPSLEAYKGCDIIDINPGVCLWSSKLHTFLQPRRHILVEPQDNVYKQWIQPLLDEPGSRYQTVDFSNRKQCWSLQSYIARDLLPDQEVLATPTSADANNNPTLLILANMTRYIGARRNRQAMGKSSDSHYQILDYIRTLESMTGFHSRGVARMLMWMPNEEKVPLLPRTIFHRRRLSVDSELSCHVEEIVGGAVGEDGVRREANIDIQSCIRTADRMARNAVQIPVSRLDEMPRQLKEIGPEAMLEYAKLSTGTIHGQRDWHRELQALRKVFAGNKESRVDPELSGQGEKGCATDELRRTPGYQRFLILQRTETAQKSMKAVIDRILRQEDEIRAEYLAIWRETSLDNPSRDERLRDLDRRIKHDKGLLQQRRRHLLLKLAHLMDDRAAWNDDPPLLLWDRRMAEPIIAHPKEFSAPRPLALLDFRPKPDVPFRLTGTQRKYLDVMLAALFGSPGHSIGAALDTMAPGAAAALIPHAPSLIDPFRGGRRDLDELRVRRLSPEMLLELAVAWEQWSFGPALEDLVRINSSAVTEDI